MTEARVDKFVFHILQVIVIQIESALQSPVGDPLLMLEQVEYLGENVIEGHSSPSTALAFAVLYPLRCHTFAMKGRVSCAEAVSRHDGRGGRRGASIRQ